MCPAKHFRQLHTESQPSAGRRLAALPVQRTLRNLHCEAGHATGGRTDVSPQSESRPACSIPLVPYIHQFVACLTTPPSAVAAQCRLICAISCTQHCRGQSEYCHGMRMTGNSQSVSTSADQKKKLNLTPPPPPKKRAYPQPPKNCFLK